MRRYRRYDYGFNKWDGLVWGLGLIGLGIMLLFDYMHIAVWGGWTYGWPALVIFLGALRLLTSRTPRRIGSSVTIVLMGAFFLLKEIHWHGLDWHHGWPLLLVALGFGSLARTIASFAMPRDDREEEVKVDVHP